jgi:cyclopropane-fatty-acyl-phospholipid synthase
MSERRVFEALLSKAGITLGGSLPSDIQIHDERAIRRMLGDSLLGIGESYMEGGWDCPRLDVLTDRVLTTGVFSRTPDWKHLPTLIKAKLFNLQSKGRARQVCEAHYDLGNDLFQAMLDPRMVYSCGYWKDAGTLAEAQEAKLELVCRKLALTPGMHVLDMGCGWGSFMKYAAEKYGVTCAGYSLSPEQTRLGRELCKGLPITFVEKDYREIQGQYDRVVSIGMLEAVGVRNFGDFMRTVSRSLKPGGAALLHTMGSSRSYTHTEVWYDRYIFPNGAIPSIAQLGSAMEGELVLEDWHCFGPDYDPTLMAWNENFQKAWPGKLEKAYSPRFKRMWEFYLLSLAGTFRARYSQLWQLVVSKPGTARWDCRLS